MLYVVDFNLSYINNSPNNYQKKMLHDIAQTIGLKVCDVPPLGDCMFESIAKQLDKLNKFNKVYTQTHHATVRQQCTAHS